MRFESAAPWHRRTGIPGDILNRNKHGGHGGRDHMLAQHNAPPGTVFPPGPEDCTSYRIKFFNCEGWGHYENQCPEATGDNTPKKTE